MTKDEALKLALSALEDGINGQTSVEMDEAITAIKEALAPTSTPCEVQDEQLRDENERLHVENRRLIDRIETFGVPVGVGGFVTTTLAQPEQEPVERMRFHSDMSISFAPPLITFDDYGNKIV